jgi:hypothetical protein
MCGVVLAAMRRPITPPATSGPARHWGARAPDFPRDTCTIRTSASERDARVSAVAATVLEARSGWLLARADGPGWLVTTQAWYPDGPLAWILLLLPSRRLMGRSSDSPYRSVPTPWR